ncbi:MAG: hypothetical protein ABF648_07970 [Propionibacterium sp.]
MAATVLAVALTGCTGSHTSVSPDQQREQLAARPLPSYIPSSAAGNTLIDGTATKPAVSMQGVPVRANLANGSTVVMNVVGPDVDRSTGDPDAESVDCGFRITFEQASATIPFALDRITATDDAGGIHQLELADNSPKPPATLEPGQQVTVSVHAMLPPGEGLIRWAPDDNHVIVVWDYIAEID